MKSIPTRISIDSWIITYICSLVSISATTTAFCTPPFYNIPNNNYVLSRLPLLPSNQRQKRTTYTDNPFCQHTIIPTTTTVTFTTTTTYRNNFLNSIGELWDEFIEVATYGPSERRLLKDRRRAAAEAAKSQTSTEKESTDDLSIESFRRARTKLQTTNELSVTNNQDTEIDNNNPSLSSTALRNELSIRQRTTSSYSLSSTTFDGYALRDLLIKRWGAPLDIEFQRSQSSVYCTVSPVAFGNRRCRHQTEMEYLCHLQGVVETLERYDNLGLFVEFVGTTGRRPKAGTDSVPFRLVLTEEERRKILGVI